jgi:phospholipase/carboxylesterase
MPHSPLYWHGPRFDEGFYTSELPAPQAFPVRTFLPTGYEPNYPYPLVVFFHGEGGSEEQILRLAPRLSRRNYICIGLRGPIPLESPAEERPGYSWGPEGEFDSFAEEYMVRAVEQTRRTYHIHSERIYLAGVCEGASLAYRLGLGMPDKVAGVISLNGAMPRPCNGGPLFRLADVRQLRVLISHGMNNSQVPLSTARRDFLCLYSAGVDVRIMTYPTTHQLHSHMLRDVNRWIMGSVNGGELGVEEVADEID